MMIIGIIDALKIVSHNKTASAHCACINFGNMVYVTAACWCTLTQIWDVINTKCLQIMRKTTVVHFASQRSFFPNICGCTQTS